MSSNRCVRFAEVLDLVSRKGYEYSCYGERDIWVDNYCTPERSNNRSIMWAKNADALSAIERNKPIGSIVIACEGMKLDLPACGIICCKDPKRVFFNVLDEFWGNNPAPGFGESSIVCTARIGNNVSIGEHCYISPDVEIGNNVIVGNNVTILNHCRINDGCYIHSSVTIGDDGMGMMVGEDGIPNKINQYGGVELGKNVEVYTGAIIMRGAIDDTVIGDNCKIGSRVTVGHNVRIGNNTMIMGSTTICGSVRIADHVYIGTGSILKNQIKVGSGAFIGMGVVADSDIEDGVAVVNSTRPNKRTGAADFLRMCVGIGYRRN